MAKPKRELPEDALARLNELVNQFDTRVDAARTAGISTDQLARYLNGLSYPSFAPLGAMADKFGFSLDWILTGQLPKHRGALKDETSKRIAGVTTQLTNPERELIASLLRVMADYFSSPAEQGTTSKPTDGAPKPPII